MANKFNQFGARGVGDPTNGTLCLNGKSLTAGNLGANDAVITDGSSKLVTTSLAAFQVGGVDTQIQFNDGGLFEGDAAMTFVKGTLVITFNGLSIDANGNLSKLGNLFLHNDGDPENIGGGRAALENISLGTGGSCTAYGASALRQNQNVDNLVAIGTSSQFNNTAGVDCTSCGSFTLTSNVSGQRCSAFGIRALQDSNANDNSAFGADALRSNTTGPENTAFGQRAAESVTTAGTCTAMGSNSLRLYVSGEGGTSFGARALEFTTGDNCTAMGILAARFNTTGTGITVMGFEAGLGALGLTIATDLTAIGDRSFRAIRLGTGNTGFGKFAGNSTEDGILNVYIGFKAAQNQVDGNRNTINGADAMAAAGSSSDNTIMGYAGGQSITTSAGGNTGSGSQVLLSLTVGTLNTAYGADAGLNLVSGTLNLLLGRDAGILYTTSESDNICLANNGVTGESDKTRIGTRGIQDACFMQGIDGVTPSGITETVIIDTTTGQLGSTSVVTALAPGYIDGLQVSDASADTKSIAAGSCRDSTNTLNIVSAGVLTPDITGSGVNGLDTGSAVSNTWYAIHVIADDAGVSAVASLFSLSATAPTLPATYDVFRRVGWVRNDGGSNFYDYYSTSTGRDRFYLWREPETILEVLSNGSATTWATVDLDELVPPTSTLAYLSCNNLGSSDAAEHFSEFRPDGSSLATGVNRVYAGAGVGNVIFFQETDASQEIQYQNNDASVDLDVKVAGYQDSL